MKLRQTLSCVFSLWLLNVDPSRLSYNQVLSADLIIALCFLAGFAYGWSQGFFAIVLTFACWVLAGVLALNCAELVSVYLEPFISDTRLSIPVAGLLIFFGTAFLCDKIFTPLLARSLTSAGFRSYDSMLGAAVSLVTTTVLLILLLDLTEHAFKKQKWWRKSAFIATLLDYRKPLKRELNEVIEDNTKGNRRSSRGRNS